MLNALQRQLLWWVLRWSLKSRQHQSEPAERKVQKHVKIRDITLGKGLLYPHTKFMQQSAHRGTYIFDQNKVSMRYWNILNDQRKAHNPHLYSGSLADTTGLSHLFANHKEKKNNYNTILTYSTILFRVMVVPMKIITAQWMQWGMRNYLSFLSPVLKSRIIYLYSPFLSPWFL